MLKRAGCGVALAFYLAPGAALAEGGVKEACASAAERAQSARQARRYRGARDELQQCARPECPAVIRVDCTTWLGQVETLIPSLVFRAHDEHGQDLFDVEVDLDGVRIAGKLDGVAVPADPGVHRVRFSAPGREPAGVEILVAEGEKARVVTAELRAPQPVAPPPPRVVDRTPIVLSWVALGVGVASLGAFAGLEVAGRSQLSSLQAGCGATGMCSSDQVAPVRAKFDAAAVTLGIGAAGVVAGTVGLIVNYVARQHPSAAWVRIVRVGAGLGTGLAF